MPLYREGGRCRRVVQMQPHELKQQEEPQVESRIRSAGDPYQLAQACNEGGIADFIDEGCLNAPYTTINQVIGNAPLGTETEDESTTK